MGFANVFNNYGKWLFYSGNTAFSDLAHRAERLAHLVASTLRRLTTAFPQHHG